MSVPMLVLLVEMTYKVGYQKWKLLKSKSEVSTFYFDAIKNVLIEPRLPRVLLQTNTVRRVQMQQV